MTEQCRCQTAEHGHPDNQCEKPATETDGYCKECHEKAAKEWSDTQPT